MRPLSCYIELRRSLNMVHADHSDDADAEHCYVGNLDRVLCQQPVKLHGLGRHKPVSNQSAMW